MNLTPEEIELFEAAPFCKCGHTAYAHADQYEDPDEPDYDEGEFCYVATCHCRQFEDRNPPAPRPESERQPMVPGYNESPEMKAARAEYQARFNAMQRAMDKRMFEDTFTPTDPPQ